MPEDTPATPDLDTIVSLCKRRGFIFQSSEIYGGLASTWDYGPLGVELKRNIKESWWRRFVWERDDMVGLDAAILMHPDAWRASGHVDAFHDPLVECKECKQRFRHDQIYHFADYDITVVAPTLDAAVLALTSRKLKGTSAPAVTGDKSQQVSHGVKITNLTEIPCPSCDSHGTLGEPRQFNLMLKTQLGPVEDTASVAYFRPETAQGIFVNFENVLTATRRKLPFGIAQIGKAFRNEITTGNFIFRTREFEMLEIEFFVRPGDDEAWHNTWLEACQDWYTGLGVDPAHLRTRAHDPDELAHYAKATYDIEYHFPWGWGEIQGIANRTDFDLKAHAKASGKQLSYFDEENKQHVVPYVIEPSAGVDRAVLTFLLDAYREEEAPTSDGKSEKRVVMKFHPDIAPIKVAVLPLSKKENLVALARDVHRKIYASGLITGMVQYDDAQSIGRRYRRQDEVGTPLCVTVDFDSLESETLKGTVTVRDRDTMKQDRVPIADLPRHLANRLKR